MRFVNCEADTAKIETPIETRKLKIFDKLDEINWKKLHHAYGTAEDVPDLLRALTSLDKKAREDALYELCGNIFHQGTRYSASAYAIPFLYGILDDENTQDKAELISYIVHLATGYPEYWLPRQKVQARTKSEKACYQAVADGEAMLLRASFDKDKAVRSHAVWALAYLAPKLQAATIARIAEMASIVGSEEKASAVFALGIIDFHSREYTYLPLFRELFSDSKDMLVKTAAAISILISACFVAKKSKCESGDEQLRFLAAEALPFFHKPVENFPFNNGDIQGYISSVLALVDAEAAMPVLPALAAVLPAQTATISMSITYAILSLIEKANPELQKPHEDFTAFEPASQNALKAIAKHGGWKVGEVTFANYRELLGDFGYPSNQEAFALFVGVKHA
jgi:hypothetical protein